MKLYLIAMSICLARVLVAQTYPVREPWHYKVPQALSDSSGWTKYRASSQARIKFLVSDSRSSRDRKIQDFLLKQPSRLCKPEEGYFAALIIQTFDQNDVNKDLLVRLSTLVMNSQGNSENDFFRQMYTTGYTKNLQPKVPGLAERLLIKYPNDRNLQYAVINDSSGGYATVNARLIARDLLIKNWKSSLSPYTYFRHLGFIDFTLLNITKERKWQPTAIQSFELALTSAKAGDDTRLIELALKHAKEWKKN